MLWILLFISKGEVEICFTHWVPLIMIPKMVVSCLKIYLLESVSLHSRPNLLSVVAEPPPIRLLANQLKKHGKMGQGLGPMHAPWKFMRISSLSASDWPRSCTVLCHCAHCMVKQFRKVLSPPFFFCDSVYVKVIDTERVVGDRQRDLPFACSLPILLPWLRLGHTEYQSLAFYQYPASDQALLLFQTY